MAGEVLRMSGVRVQRGDNTLLDGIDWTVRENERWSVLGPNGAGKTTLLQVASARLFPTAGVVDLLDERLRRVDVFGLRPRIGLGGAPRRRRRFSTSSSPPVTPYSGAPARTTTRTTSPAPASCWSSSAAARCWTGPSACSARVSASGCS